ncbi:mannose-1-phosphate guanylyltransferase/mannose-6-phosphate isomerase [Alsobacter sp. SYSU M60028]|uniref:mannose-1-phosphate guanylyltransferase n=1 Tax=Alsobacter ponti TaxID=2962936 RepID=A0ABT1L9P8_9HYPH|nr:mannose-1-phosphate guanylyltransferase/mannose-6-phosphate isomerase [Alsobacter ponti]MCP8938222.1 mannose-1-phosphate guanylyltransferase/mannose-6-phosphate isomerase [Alsobacter ponti]
MESTAITPVILCGGAGTRLWPASRESMPKQFMPLLGELSTFQETMLRVADGSVFGRAIVVTAADFRFVAAEQLQAIGVEADIVLEPARRDSAAAVAVAAEMAARRDPDSVVLALAADHLVRDAEAFVAACRRAAALARQGFVMTLGIAPDRPATGYGYISPGAPLGEGGARVERFVEKPDAATASRYVAEGYLWNSGNFLFRARDMREELAACAPATLAAASAALDAAVRDLDFIRLDARAFAAAPKISIDYAVMEKTQRAGVVPVDCGWSDVGSWTAVWEVSARDAEGNAVRGRASLVATRDSLVHSDGPIVGLVGVDNAVVVASRDAVLVTTRERAGEVKDLVAALRAAGEPEADAHLRIHRPWGWYQRIELGARFQVKRIQVKPGARLSLQKHMHRAEHWVVVSGTAEVTVDDRVWLMGENEAAYLPLGCVHRLANPGKIPLEIIEVQVGSYTGEDDIVRIEDVYGR